MSKILCLIISVLLVLECPVLFDFVQERAVFADSGNDNDLFGNSRNDSYAAYRDKYSDVKTASEHIFAGVENITSYESGDLIDDWADTGINAVSIKPGGWVEYTVDIPADGLYNISINYYPVLKSGTTIQFECYIDGKLPFYESAYMMLYSVWKDTSLTGETRDAADNDLIPEQKEVSQWISGFLRDANGVYADPYMFSFSEGEHTIRFSSTREDLTVSGILLSNEFALPLYSEVEAEYKEKEYKYPKQPLIAIEAENTSYKSDSSLYARSDRTSPDTTPVSDAKVRLNLIGGTSYSSVGQWVEYDFNVSESGLYKIALRVRQNFMSGSFVSRNFYIDGKIPYREFSSVQIPYDMNWQNMVPDHAIYLEQGDHTLKIEVTVGSLTDIISTIEDSVFQLNQAYRKIIMITGTIPDRYRDYKLDQVIPEVFNIFSEQSEALLSCDTKLLELTGKRGSMNGILQSLSDQLVKFTEKPETVQLRVNSFKDNIGSLGDWLIDIKSQPLEIDKIYIYPADRTEDVPNANRGFLTQIAHVFRLFVSSFTEDYNSIGGDSFTGGSLEIWVQTGRDQANIIRNLISNYFTPDHEINVTLKLVQGQLLAATAAGTGPDVALQVGNAEPVNYALRKAVKNLKEYDDFEQIISRFRESAYLPFEFNGGIYALPETHTYPVLFYRTDVLTELGLEVPQTWSSLFHAVGILQKNSMTMGIRAPSSIVGSSDGLSSMAMFMYQRGGQFYTDDNKRSNFESEEAIEAFKLWVSLYQDYSLPLSYNAAYRFRTGEMPLLIEDFTLYNMLSVTAPEIRGMWGIAKAPGTPLLDGSIDHTVAGTGICCMMLDDTDSEEESWEFMKWWTSENIQLAFAKDIETQLGISARYPSANIEAFAALPWTADEYQLLNEQFDNVKAIPQIAGGYFTSRHLNNAFRRVINYNEDPRRVLLEYTISINSEITAKRTELGLD